MSANQSLYGPAGMFIEVRSTAFKLAPPKAACVNLERQNKQVAIA